jgi:hypothetical protein
LKLSVNPVNPFIFMTCSADGTVRMFDVRKSYLDTETTELQNLSHTNQGEFVVVRAPCDPLSFVETHARDYRPRPLEAVDQRDSTQQIGTFSPLLSTMPR